MLLGAAKAQGTRTLIILMMLLTFNIALVFGSNLLLARADDEISDLRSLILRLREESYYETGIAFKFRDPLVMGNEISQQQWVVPYNNAEDGLQRMLGEVGEDYVCFTDIAGSSTVMRCTPFSNIVSIGVGYFP